MLTQLRRIIPLAAVVLLAAACTHKTTPAVSGTPTGTSSSVAGTVNGTWSGTWTRTSPPPGSGTFTLSLRQQGSSIDGTIDVVASACLTKGTISGTITGASVTLHTVTPPVAGTRKATGDYQGTLAGDTLSGTLTVTCSAGTGVGTWTVTRK
jgi:hypothetical protein